MIFPFLDFSRYIRWSAFEIKGLVDSSSFSSSLEDAIPALKDILTFLFKIQRTSFVILKKLFDYRYSFFS